MACTSDRGAGNMKTALLVLLFAAPLSAQFLTDPTLLMLERYPATGNVIDQPGTVYRARATDGQVYMCTVASGAGTCVFQVKRGESLVGTVAVPGGVKFTDQAEGSKSVPVQSVGVRIGTLTPPTPASAGRRRAVVPPRAPYMIVYGEELLVLPPITSPPFDKAVDRVITGVSPEGPNAGRVVWIVVLAQGGLPVPPGFRVVWP